MSCYVLSVAGANRFKRGQVIRLRGWPGAGGYPPGKYVVVDIPNSITLIVRREFWSWLHEALRLLAWRLRGRLARRRGYIASAYKFRWSEAEGSTAPCPS